MSLSELRALLAFLEPGMQLFVPRAGRPEAIHDSEAHRDAEIAALGFAHGCDLLMTKPLSRPGEIGYLFVKRGLHSTAFWSEGRCP
jgi:hypothetical protein